MGGEVKPAERRMEAQWNHRNRTKKSSWGMHLRAAVSSAVRDKVITYLGGGYFCTHTRTHTHASLQVIGAI